MAEQYHYTESGLDDVWLRDGFHFHDDERGRTVSFEDVEGLHRAIGLYRAKERKRLTAKDIRFLRVECLLSQRALAAMLGVDEQTVARWEKGKAPMPVPAEASLRMIYIEHVGGDGTMTGTLRVLADLDAAIETLIVMAKGDQWEIAEAA